VVHVKPQPERYEDGQADLDRLVDARLRAEHDGDIEAILAPLAQAIVHDGAGGSASTDVMVMLARMAQPKL
jgi:hypothetical protein